MKRSNLARAAAGFFAVMLLFTVLSRAAYQSGTAVVSVARPESRSIVHRVTAEGRVEENSEMAVTTEPNLRVSAICVEEGERVKRGDVLFEIDRDLLDEAITGKEQEIEKQKLQLADAKSAREVREKQHENAVAQAEESAALSAGRANALAARAAQALADAKRAAGAAGSTSSGSADTAVRAQLVRDVQEKEAALKAAESDLTSVRANLAAAELLENRQGISAADIGEDWDVGEEVFGEDAAAGETTAETAWGSDFGQGGEMGFDGAADPDAGENFDVDAETDAGMDALTGIFLDSGEESADGDISTVPDVYDVEPPQPVYTKNKSHVFCREVEMKHMDVSPLICAEYDAPEFCHEVESVRVDAPPAVYGSNETEVSSTDITLTLAAAEERVETAKEELEAARAALSLYEEERAAESGSASKQSGEELSAGVKSAQQAYEDAARDANEAAVTGQRSIASASISEAEDSTERIGEITCEQMELELKKLQRVQAAGGKIRAERDGLVTKISVLVGERTGDGAAMLLTDLSKGYRFTADLAGEEECYIGTGDEVTIISGDNKIRLEKLPVASIRTDEQDRTVRHLTVQLPDDSLELGARGTLDFTRSSQNYRTCIPLSALHLDARNQTYVLVPDTYTSIMGTELRARRVDVTVLEKNESYAALADGSLTSEQSVIVSSDKALEEGSRVRVGAS